MSRRNLLAVSLLIILLAAPAIGHAIYVWRDAQGVTQYSDVCPAGVKCREVRKRKTDSSGTTSTTSTDTTSTLIGATSTTTSGTPSTTSTSGTPQIIWSAGHETGTFVEWNGDGGGNVYRRLNEIDTRSPDATAEISQDRARSGQRSVKFSIRTDPGFYPNAAKGQVVRWNEPRQNTDYYYSVWFFIPQPFNAWPDGPSGGQGWLNLFQFHSVSNAGRVHSGVVLFGRSNPTTGKNYFQLFLSPDFGNNIGPLNSPVDMPFGRWFNVEMRMKCAANRQGLVQVWQDGVQIFNLPNVTTNQPDADAYCHWMVNAYGQYILPSPTVIYVDDVVISTGRVWQP